jgi:hypothetical protein
MPRLLRRCENDANIRGIIKTITDESGVGHLKWVECITYNV